MAKVLFFNSPMYGHVLPTLAIVQELVHRGEQVIYYLTDEFAQSIHAAGATFRRYESTMKNNRPEGRFSSFLAAECQYVLPQIIESVRREKPDYILYEDSCLWGRIVAHSFNVPIISCQSSLAVNKHFTHIPNLLDISQGQADATAPFKLIIETLNDLAPLADLCATYHLPAPAQDMDSLFFHAEEFNVLFISRLLQPAGDTFDDRFVFVGPPEAPQYPTSDLLAPPFFPALVLPVLYLSLGTIYNLQPDFYRLCFQAFGGQPWHVIVSTGKQVDWAELGLVPENVHLHRSVPQLAILQHTALFITHGGLNSIMEALYYGVPVVIIPQMPEQVITARRIVELGVGIMLDKNKLTVEVLQDAVQTLVQDVSLPARMKFVQEEVQASGGATHAVDAILQFRAQKVAG